MQPEENISRCTELITQQWPSASLSSLYASAAREIEDQDQFINAVAMVETEESPTEVANMLRRIERILKKDPPYKFGPRTIDLDILLYGNEIREEEGLTIPHPRMHERRFVLDPLCELLNENEMHPLLGITWAKLKEEVAEQDCKQMEETA